MIDKILITNSKERNLANINPLTSDAALLTGLRTANVFCLMWSKFIPSSSSKGGSFSISSPPKPEQKINV